MESCNLKAVSSLLQQELNTSEPGRHLLEALLSLTKRGRMVDKDSLILPAYPGMAIINYGNY